MNIIVIPASRTYRDLKIEYTRLIEEHIKDANVVGWVLAAGNLKKDAESFIETIADSDYKDYLVLVLNSEFYGKLASVVKEEAKFLTPIVIGSNTFIKLPEINLTPQSKGVFIDSLYFLNNGAVELDYYTFDSTTPDSAKEALLAKISDYKGFCALDIETDNKVDLTANILTLAITFAKSTIVIKDFNKIEMVSFFKVVLLTLHINKVKIVAHNANFEIKQIINCFYTKKQWSIARLHEGLDLFEYVEDTQVLTYIAFNNTFLNRVNLKQFGFRYFGDYGVDFKKLTYSGTDSDWAVSEDFLLYNARDTYVTYKLYEKLIKKDYVMEAYTAIFRDSITPIAKMCLLGFPLKESKVTALKNKVDAIRVDTKIKLQNNPIIRDFTLILREEARTKANKKLKKKVKPIEDFEDIVFNPASGPQVSGLLYKHLKLPFFIRTKSGKPSSNGDNINYTKEVLEKRESTKELQTILEILDCLTVLSDSAGVSATFLPAFDKAVNESLVHKDRAFLRGDLNLGGTISGRLSSSNPNMQNLPTGSLYGKAVKDMITAPKGWLICSADFSSLEDRILTIQTKAKNKLKIYLEGYDGHSINTFFYFKPQLPGIVDTVDSINSISEKYPELRSSSKGPTFALAYGGTAYTLVTKAGFSENQANFIVASYMEAYPEIFALKEKLHKTYSNQGYIDLSFGLRLWTVYSNNKNKKLYNISPNNLDKEHKTVVNAYTQTWGLLMNRALIATEKRLKVSKYRNDILMINTIHDSGYFLVREEPNCVKELNDILINEMSFNNLPSIYSTDVPIKASLEVGYNILNTTVLDNYSSLEVITDVLEGLKQETI